mmetsp:Transcript_66771/g.204338  ORF Transcript_66771/g.204338 Transcript_66771/m.204338 type:complete len:1453 (-) Transcript_66771:153-4511(-)
MPVQNRLGAECLQERELDLEVVDGLPQLLCNFLHLAHVVIVESLDHLVHILEPLVEQRLDVHGVQRRNGLGQPILLLLLELDDVIPQEIVRREIVDHAIQLEVVCHLQAEQLLPLHVRPGPVNALVERRAELVDLGLVIGQAFLVGLVLLPNDGECLAPIPHVVVEDHLLALELRDLRDVSIDEEVPHPHAVVVRASHETLRRGRPSRVADSCGVPLQRLRAGLPADGREQLHVDVLARGHERGRVGRPDHEIGQALDGVDDLRELGAVLLSREVPNADRGVGAARRKLLGILGREAHVEHGSVVAGDGDGIARLELVGGLLAVGPTLLGLGVLGQLLVWPPQRVHVPRVPDADALLLPAGEQVDAVSGEGNRVQRHALLALLRGDGHRLRHALGARRDLPDLEDAVLAARGHQLRVRAEGARVDLCLVRPDHLLLLLGLRLVLHCLLALLDLGLGRLGLGLVDERLHEVRLALFQIVNLDGLVQVVRRQGRPPVSGGDHRRDRAIAVDVREVLACGRLPKVHLAAVPSGGDAGVLGRPDDAVNRLLMLEQRGALALAARREVVVARGRRRHDDDARALRVLIALLDLRHRLGPLVEQLHAVRLLRLAGVNHADKVGALGQRDLLLRILVAQQSVVDVQLALFGGLQLEHVARLSLPVASDVHVPGETDCEVVGVTPWKSAPGLRRLVEIQLLFGADDVGLDALGDDAVLVLVGEILGDEARLWHHRSLVGAVLQHRYGHDDHVLLIRVRPLVRQFNPLGRGSLAKEIQDEALLAADERHDRVDNLARGLRHNLVVEVKHCARVPFQLEGVFAHLGDLQYALVPRGVVSGELVGQACPRGLHLLPIDLLLRTDDVWLPAQQRRGLRAQATLLEREELGVKARLVVLLQDRAVRSVDGAQRCQGDALQFDGARLAGQRQLHDVAPAALRLRDVPGAGGAQALALEGQHAVRFQRHLVLGEFAVRLPLPNGHELLDHVGLVLGPDEVRGDLSVHAAVGVRDVVGAAALVHARDLRAAPLAFAVVVDHDALALLHLLHAPPHLPELGVELVALLRLQHRLKTIQLVDLFLGDVVLGQVDNRPAGVPVEHREVAVGLHRVHERLDRADLRHASRASRTLRQVGDRAAAHLGHGWGSQEVLEALVQDLDAAVPQEVGPRQVAALAQRTHQVAEGRHRDLALLVLLAPLEEEQHRSVVPFAEDHLPVRDGLLRIRVDGKLHQIQQFAAARRVAFAPVLHHGNAREHRLQFGLRLLLLRLETARVLKVCHDDDLPTLRGASEDVLAIYNAGGVGAASRGETALGQQQQQIVAAGGELLGLHVLLARHLLGAEDGAHVWRVRHDRLFDLRGEHLRSLVASVERDEQVEYLVVPLGLFGVFHLVDHIPVVHARVPVAVHGPHLLRHEQVVVVERGEGDVGLQRQTRVVHHRERAAGDHLVVLPSQALRDDAVDLGKLRPSD